jgi:peptide-methionine (R)-S-oxide reductase
VIKEDESMTVTPTDPQTRRRFLQAGALAPAALTFGAAAPATAQQGPAFDYEVQRTEADWRAMLTEQEYFVLREGGTEVPHSSLNAFETREGHYACKGCGLVNFDSRWKVPKFEIGWAFFSQARPTTILTSIDESHGGMRGDGPEAAIECHCRRCGSHFGHILLVETAVLHCLNGSAFDFTPA